MNRRVFLGAAVISAAAIGFGLYQPEAHAENLTLEALSGQALATSEDTLLVDIRRPEEWKQTGVIEGALLVTYTDPQSFLQAVQPHLRDGQKLALVCRSGNRTSQATRQIAQSINGHVIDVQGGMNRILREGYTPVAPTRERGCSTC